MSVPRLNRGKIIALDRLLNMMYRPAEIASEVGISTDALYRSYIPAGAPVELDDEQKVWICGTRFAAWAREYLSTTRRGQPKAQMTDTQGYCMRCNQIRELVEIRRKPHSEKAGVIQMSGKCPECGAKVNRFFRDPSLPPKDTPEKVSTKAHDPLPSKTDRNLICRQNWLDVQEYLHYQLEIAQVDPKTERAIWARLRHLVEWAGDKPYPKLATMRVSRQQQTFPAYAELVRVERTGEPFSASHLAGIMKSARAFFKWARDNHPGRYKSIEMTWIQSLRPSRARSEQSVLVDRKLYTIEDVLTMITVPAATTAQRRIRAAVAMLFLSGMRIGAFTSLSLQCVDLSRRQILQLPALGVHTKNNKAAKTYLLNIPELLEIVQAWDREVRTVMPADAYWFAQLSPFGELVTSARRSSRVDVKADFNRALRDLCERAGVPYLSAHKLRHGNAVYALKRAKTVAQLKAVSQNLMHSNMGITDGIYGRLVDDDVMDYINQL